MKVKFDTTVDIDPELWDMNFGTGTQAKDVREDVRSALTSAVHAYLEQIGVTR